MDGDRQRDGGALRKLTGLVTFFQGILPYQRTWLSQDVLAGITLAALAIPEVMGYSTIAGVPVIVGLYTILFPPIAFAIFGSSRHLVVGGDSATAAIMYAGLAGLSISSLQPQSSEWVALASLSALIAGGMLIVARIARLGFMADFISRTVLVGFLTGVGIQVAAGQVGGMLGIPPPDVDVDQLSGTLIKLGKTLGDIDSTSGATLAVSAAVLATLVVFERWIKVIPGGLVAVIGSIAASWAFNLDEHGVSTLGHVPSGLPEVGLPDGVGWNDASMLLATSGAMFMVILAQSAATSRVYAIKYKERFVEDNDLVGLGFANLAAGLTSSFVVNGSPTKTEMVDEAKSHTQVAQLVMAACVGVVLLFLTKPLEYLPHAVLSTVVFLIGIKLVSVAGMRQIWRLQRDEFWIAASTTVTVVAIGVVQGIVLAMILSLVLHVKRHYAPHDAVIVLNDQGEPTAVPPTPGATTEPGLVVYRFGAGLFYANSSRLVDQAMGLVDVPEPPRWFILQAQAIDDVDYTGGKSLLELATDLGKREIVLAVAEPTDEVLAELRRFGVIDEIGEDHVYATLAEALAAFHLQGSGEAKE